MEDVSLFKHILHLLMYCVVRLLDSQVEAILQYISTIIFYVVFEDEIESSSVELVPIKVKYLIEIGL